MGLEARDTQTTDDGIVARVGGQVEAVPDAQLDGPIKIGQAETDRSALDHEHLVVRMVVGAVAVMRTVRPRSGIQSLGAEAGGRVRRSARLPVCAHATDTPMIEPTANVTPAAAAPIRT